MQSLKIVIPSHKRHDKVHTKNLITNPILCVEESQRDIYKEYNPECEIITHPDNVIGLIPKRNWMLNYFGDLFMLDDDLRCFKKMYIKPGESPVIKSKSEILHQIYKLYDLACLLNINVFGFSKNPHPLAYDCFTPISLNKQITGCAYGVRKKEHIKWDESIKLKEDIYISCIAKYFDRKILVDNRYNFEQIGTFVSSGGLAGIRNYEEEFTSMLKIKKLFGESIVLKKDSKIAKKKTKHNISVKFKY